MNRFLLSVSFISAMLMAQNLLAAPQKSPQAWYQIEILVYEPIKQGQANESWPMVRDVDKPQSLIELTPITESNRPNTQVNSTTKAFQKLLPENLVLAEIASKLNKTGRYRVITLQGWQQPVKQRHEAIAIHLTDKLQTPATFTNNTQSGNIVLNPPSENILVIEPTLNETDLVIAETPSRIDGTVTISLSRYLHMALNIRYYNPDVYLAEQIAQQRLDEDVIEIFKLKQSRRMRSKEIHVFDHPYFGIIATIIPVAKNKASNISSTPSLLNTTSGQ